MRLEEILFLMYQQWMLYALSLIINILLCWVFFKRYIKSFLDPLFFRVIGVCFANTIPLFMWMCGAIKEEYFVAFIVLEVCFWVGFLLNKPKPQVKIRVTGNNRRMYYLLFLYSVIIIVLFRLFFYLNYGIPLLMENRADKYLGAEGLGGLDRLTYVLEFYCLIYSFAHFKTQIPRVRLLSRFYLVMFAMFCVFEGAKGAIISVLGPLFFYVYYIKETKLTFKRLLLMGIIVLGVAIVVMLVQGSSQDTVLTSLLLRFMMFGDVYYEGFGNEAVTVVKVLHPIKDLLVNLLAPFRLMDYNAGVDVVPTIQIHWYVYPELSDINGGPNNRVPFLYYCFFGTLVGSILSFITGFLVSKVMYNTFKYLKKNLLGLSIYASIYTIACGFITDPIMAISSIPSIIFGYFFLVFVYLISKSSAKV